MLITWGTVHGGAEAGGAAASGHPRGCVRASARAFAGKLVPQDSTNESVRALLERIQVEREGATGNRILLAQARLHRI